MAISAITTFEVRPTNGVDTNGGGFVPGATGTDWSQQNAAQYALTGLTTSGASATIATASAATDMVGNIIQITSGTNFNTGFFQILSVVAGVSITVDRNATTGVGAAGVGNIGGALKLISKANTASGTASVIWVKAEATISVSSTLTINYSSPSSGQTPFIAGYTTTRGDNGRVTVQASATTSGDMVNVSGPGISILNFIFDGNAKTNTGGLQLSSTAVRAVNCLGENCTNEGFFFNGTSTCALNCQATVCSGSTAAFHFGNNGYTICLYCVAYSNTSAGFGSTGNSTTTLIHCISGNNSGASSDGFAFNSGQATAVVINCTAYTNGRDGFQFTISGQSTVNLFNNIAYGNTRYGFNQSTTSTTPTGILFGNYNAYGANSTANLNNITAGANDVTLTGDPTVAGGSNNFALNNTAGAGAACRAAAFPGAFAVGGTGYLDLGALQHQDSPATTTYVISPNRTNVFVSEGEQ